MTNLLNLIGKAFQSSTVRAVEHAERGELFMAKDVIEAVGYDLRGQGVTATLNMAAIPSEERVEVRRSTVIIHHHSYPNRGAIFLTRKGVNLLLMTSTQPQAKAFRDWLAGDVVPAIADTGGYLLNEEARTTAKADTRTTIPLPAGVGNAIAALIAEKEARIAAEMETLVAWKKNAETEVEKAELAERLAKAEQEAAAQRLRAKQFEIVTKTITDTERSLAVVAGTLEGLNKNKIRESLYKVGLLGRDRYTGTYFVKGEYRDVLFGQTFNPKYGSMDISVLPKGMVMLVKLYRAGKLMMKKGFTPVIA